MAILVVSGQWLSLLLLRERDYIVSRDLITGSDSRWYRSTYSQGAMFAHQPVPIMGFDRRVTLPASIPPSGASL